MVTREELDAARNAARGCVESGVRCYWRGVGILRRELPANILWKECGPELEAATMRFGTAWNDPVRDFHYLAAAGSTERFWPGPGLPTHAALPVYLTAHEAVAVWAGTVRLAVCQSIERCNASNGEDSVSHCWYELQPQPCCETPAAVDAEWARALRLLIADFRPVIDAAESPRTAMVMSRDWSNYRSPEDWRKILDGHGKPSSETSWRTFRDRHNAEKHPDGASRRVRFRLDTLQSEGVRVPEMDA